MTKETGGAAFPIHWENHHSGMTLRDYFAAKAMQAIAVETLKSSKLDVNLLAKNAYVVADEMLKAREQ